MRQVFAGQLCIISLEVTQQWGSCIGKKLLMERHENRLCREMAAAPTLGTFKNRLE